MMNKAVGAAILVALGVAIGFVTFTAWHKSAAAAKPRDIPAELTAAVNKQIAGQGVVVAAKCQLKKGQYACITIIDTPTGQDCVGILFTLQPDGSLPPVGQMSGQKLPSNYCGLQG